MVTIAFVGSRRGGSLYSREVSGEGLFQAPLEKMEVVRFPAYTPAAEKPQASPPVQDYEPPEEYIFLSAREAKIYAFSAAPPNRGRILNFVRTDGGYGYT